MARDQALSFSGLALRSKIWEKPPRAMGFRDLLTISMLHSNRAGEAFGLRPRIVAVDEAGSKPGGLQASSRARVLSRVFNIDITRSALLQARGHGAWCWCCSGCQHGSDVVASRERVWTALPDCAWTPGKCKCLKKLQLCLALASMPGPSRPKTRNQTSPFRRSEGRRSQV